MRRIVLAVSVLILMASAFASAPAQTPMVATPAEQAKIKPLVTEEAQAREAMNAKKATLPEAKAVRDAEEALKKANEALEKAADSLPETAAWKVVGAKALDAVYGVMAEHKLNSREFRPEMNAKGELTFARFAPPKP